MRPRSCRRSGSPRSTPRSALRRRAFTAPAAPTSSIAPASRPTERRKNRDEEHLGAALVRAAGDAGLELPDAAGRLRLLDYQVRAKIGPIDEPDTKGIARFDLLGIGPDDRLAVIQMRYLEPVGDALLTSATRRCACCSKASPTARSPRRTAPRSRRRSPSASGATSRARRRCSCVLASPRYWELCRKRSTQKGAAWIRELERIAAEAPAAIGVAGALPGAAARRRPGLDLRRGRPGARRPRAAAAGVGAERGPREAEAEAAAARCASSRSPQIVEADPSRPVRSYSVSDSYRAGDRIAHPKLGTGVVQGIAGPGKIRVRFDERQSVLVHERSA